MDGALVYWLFALSIAGLAIGFCGSVVMFFLYLFRLVD